MTAKYIPTKQELEIIKKLFIEKTPIENICKVIGISFPTIVRIAKENNIENLNRKDKFIPNDEFIFSIKKLTEEKYTINEIAKKLNISWIIIRNICIENNIDNLPKNSPTMNNIELVEKVKHLNSENIHIKKIAEMLGVSKKAVSKIYKELNLKTIKYFGKDGDLIPDEKLCSSNDGKDGCNKIKSRENFTLNSVKRKRGKIYYRLTSLCKECSNKISGERSRRHYKNNKNYYRLKRKIIRAKENDNPIFKLRSRVSTTICKALKKQNGSKNGRSIMDYLPYSIEELKKHIEKQFKESGNEWMTWENHGAYIFGGKKVWHIDHIIPQSLLPFDSMEHPNFLKCWSLENLRPLEASKNISKSNKIIT